VLINVEMMSANQNWPGQFYVLPGQNLGCTGNLTVHSEKLVGALLSVTIHAEVVMLLCS